MPEEAVSNRLLKWKCHKVVEAGKITSMARNTLYVSNEHGIPIGISREDAWMEKHSPDVGGYYVRYEGGYDSYSPASAFEIGYEQLKHDDPMAFSMALRLIKTGCRLKRVGWNGPAQSIWLWTPDSETPATVPFMMIQTVQGDLVPWLPSQTDLLADDWVLVG